MKEKGALCREADVAVVGAGITGLTAAHFLMAQGVDVQVIEAQDRPGGAIRTTCQSGFQIEHGPNTLLDTHPLLRELFARLGIEGEVIYASEQAKNRYIVRQGQLHPLPLDPLALIRSRLLSTKAKFRLLAEPLVRRAPADAEETLAQFVERRLGREFLEYAIDAFVAGVYAGVPEQLSVRDAFPRLYRLEEKYGSILKGAVLGRRERRRSGRTPKQSARLFSFRRGLQTLVDALAQKQREVLHLSTSLKALFRRPEGYCLQLITGQECWYLKARAVLLAIPAQAYRELEFGFDLEAACQALGQIYSPPVAVVFFGYRQPPGGRALDGFGFLIPTREQRQILGTLWSSTLFPGRAPAGGAALTTFVGGVRQPDHALLPDDRLVEIVRAELRDLLRIESPPDEVFIRRWPQAIPQYQLGHRQRIDVLERSEAQYPGLYLAGNFRGGISVGDCIEQAEKVAGRIAAELKGRG